MSFALDPSFSAAFGWALLHSLWQCAAVAALAWVALRLLRHRDARSRYLVACLGLGLMLALPAATFALLWSPVRVETGAPDGAEVLLLVARTSALPAEAALRPFLPWLLAAWTAGASVMALRLAGGWCWLQRLRWLGVEAPGTDWQARLDRLSAALGLRRAVRLLASTAVEGPVVLGWLRPVILVPVAVFAGLPPAALEAVLIHELAHVRRLDYLMNLLQSAVEVLLFYHPATWWLSAQIRTERENCCDDIAVSLCGDPLLYARALAALEELRAADEPSPRLALAAQGGTLMHRIHRLLTPALPPSPAARAGLVAALAVSVLGAATTFGSRQDTPKPAEAKQAAKEEKRIVTMVVKGDDKAPRKLKVQMKGHVKLQPDQQPPVALEDGGRLEIEGRDGEQLRTYLAERLAGVEKRIFTLEGRELPPDAPAEAWLKRSLESLKGLKLQGGRELKLGRLPVFEWTEQNAKAQQQLEAKARELEKKAQELARQKGSSKESAQLQAEIATAAGEIAAAAKKLAEHRHHLSDQRLKVMVETAKTEAEHAHQKAEQAHQESRIMILKAPEAHELSCEDEVEIATEDVHPGGTDHRIVIRKQIGGEPGREAKSAPRSAEERKVEIEALKKAVESMQKRIQKLEQSGAK